MPKKTVTVYRDRTGLLAIGIICIIVSFALIFCLSRSSDIIFLIINALFGLIFGLSGIVNLAKANEIKPAVEINDDGIMVRDISIAPISWRGIADARLGRTRAAWNISLKLHPDTFATTRPKLGSRLFSRSTVTFMASYLDRSPENLIELINTHIRTSREERPS